MRKIEKLDEKTIKRKAHSDYNSCNFEVVFDKINELVDAINKQAEGISFLAQICKRYEDEKDAEFDAKQTQEPEMCNRCGFIHMKEDGCPKPTLKEPEMNGHWVVDQGGNKFWATDHKKEPECEHEWFNVYGIVHDCKKCGKRKLVQEKPAKKECETYCNCKDQTSGQDCSKHKKDELAEKYQAMFLENRKDCGFGTFKIPDYKEMSKLLADEARKYMREIVKDIETSDWATAEYLKKELLARLKESK